MGRGKASAPNSFAERTGGSSGCAGMGASPGEYKTDHEFVSRLEFAACLALFVVGVYSTSFGPALGILADDFGVSLDRAGLMLTLLFLGSIVASGSMAVWLHRFDPKHFAGTGLMLVAVGAVGIGLAGSWAAVLVSVCVVGAGGGLMDAGSHTIAARESADVSRGVNRLNVYFAIGAIVGPVLVGLGALDR